MSFEREANWSTIFPIMAFARQFGFYTLIITYWIHFRQMGFTLYLGILGFFLIYFMKFIGICIVRNCMSNQIPKTRGKSNDFQYSQVTPSFVNFGRRTAGTIDINSSHTQVMIGNRPENTSWRESLKTNLILANTFGLVSASIFFCFNSKVEINGFLLMTSFVFFGLY